MTLIVSRGGFSKGRTNREFGKADWKAEQRGYLGPLEKYVMSAPSSTAREKKNKKKKQPKKVGGVTQEIR